MYRVFLLCAGRHDPVRVEVRRNGEYLTTVTGATAPQALRMMRRAVRIARHAGEFAETPEQVAERAYFESPVTRSAQKAYR